MTARPEASAVLAAAGATVGDPRGQMLDLWASCAGGCESEAAAELAALGWRRRGAAAPAGLQAGEQSGLCWERGSVYGRADLATLYRTLAAARTVTRVTALERLAEVDTLDEVRDVIADVDWSALPDAPFAVEPERHGSHEFRSPDIGRVAGAAVIDRYRAACGVRLPVDLDEPTSVVRVELWGRRLRVGVELSHGSLHRRSYLPESHHAGLKPTIAACLLVMARWHADEHLLDPFTGSATIPVEAGLAALRRPPHRSRATRLAALDLHDPACAAEVGAALDAARVDRALRITGIDRFSHHVGAGRRNLAAAALSGGASIHTGDATVLAGIDRVGCVVTNPPYGMRAGSNRILPALYTRSLAAIADRLQPGGRVVVLAPAWRLVTSAAQRAGLTPAGRRAIGLGAFDAYACRFTAT